MEHQNKNLSCNVYSEPLNPDIINISENAKIKMKEYYEIMEMEGRVSRGKMSPLNVIPAGIYLLKVNNRNTTCEIYSTLTMKTPEQHQVTLFWCLYC